MTPSDEQQTVINAIRDGYNVQVDAVAGSGKTTTILSLADQLSDKIIIQLTYNAELKDEVNAKKEKYGETMYLDGLSIYTYHGLATKFYTDEAKRDIGISHIVSSDMKPRRKLPRIHILAMDEIQDMNELYYKFIRKFIKDIGGDIQLLVLGDVFQGLYEFKGADTRFLTYASSLWRPHSPFPFVQLKLTTSYRVTNPIALFVNEVMIGKPRIKAQKYGHNVLFIRHTNPFESAKIIAHRILAQLKDGTLKPDDIFVLSASVKSPNSPLKKAENILVSNGVPCYTPMNETCSIKSNVIKNKVIFASFHQSKGRERKLVIVFGFDQTYFEYYNRDADPTKCPSTLYVAATRATETLILIETGDPLQFLQRTHHQISTSNHTSFVGIPLGIMNPSSTPKEEATYQKTSPSNLIKFMDESLLVALADRVDALFEIDERSYPVGNVILQSDVETTYGSHLLCEEVFDINGLAIPAMFEEMHSPDKMSEIKRFVQAFYARSLLKNTDHFLVGKIKTIDFDSMSIPDYLKMTNIYISLQEKLHFKVAQINYYNWLSEKEVTRIMSNMGRHIGEPQLLQYEETIVDYEDKNYAKMDAFIESHIETQLRFNARVDAMTKDTVWEFKCVDTLEIEHFLQVIIYAWIWRLVCEPIRGTRVFKIMNIRTAEVQVLNYEEAEIEAIMGLILKSKYQPKQRLSQSLFEPV
jgi:hypothetical protein